MARYQAGSFDFLISPRDPVLALQNLGPYSNPIRGTNHFRRPDGPACAGLGALAQLRLRDGDGPQKRPALE